MSASSQSIQFISNPEPKLILYGVAYTGVSMLEILSQIIESPDQHPTLNIAEVQKYFSMLALFFQQPLIPTLGFKRCTERAVVPSKRIIDVGYDLTITSIYKKVSESITMYETDIALDIPTGYYVELVPRSSMSKTGYVLANSVGIIDPSYTGSVKVPLIKVDKSMPNLKLPVCIAQLILKPYVYAYSREITEIKDTTRGEQGFGSTNHKHNH